MKTSAAKAKGRRTQNLVAGVFHTLGVKLFGLKKGDVEPRPMGQSGVDIIFSPSAKEFFPFDIECKTVEKLNIVGEYNMHYRQYENSPNYKLLIHSKNNSKTLVTLSFKDFVSLFFSKCYKPGFDYNEFAKMMDAIEANKNSWEAIQRLDSLEDNIKDKQ